MFEAFTCQLADTYCYSNIISLEFLGTFMYYFPLTLGTFFVLWVWKKDFFMPSRINKKFPARSRIVNELKYSFSTYLIYASLGCLTFITYKLGWLQISLKLSDFSISYLVFSFFVLTFMHETWFYFMHRAIHSKKLFKYTHRVHHMSNNPSPLAAHSFDFAEAFLQYVYLAVFMVLIPTHPIVLLIQAMVTMVLNVYIHSGYEFLPRGWARGKLTGWFNSSTHHNMHHSRVNCNYSLYLNFWDRVCGTNHPDYVDYFEEVVDRRNDKSALKTNKSNEGVLTQP